MAQSRRAVYFLVGGEGELREAELRIECWILLHCKKCLQRSVWILLQYISLYFASASGSEDELRTVDFGDSGCNNTTNQ